MYRNKIIALGLVATLLIVAGAVWGKQWLSAPGKHEEDTTQFLQKMLDANLPGQQCIELSGEMVLIDATKDEEKIVEQHPFQWWFGNGLTSFLLDSVMVVQDTSYSLQVDHREETIQILPMKKDSAVQWSLGQILTSLKDMQAKITLENEGAYKVLTVDSLALPDFQGYRIFVDPRSYEVKKILIGMNRLQPLGSTGFDPQDEELYTYFLEIRYNQRKPVSKTEMPRLEQYVQVSPENPGEFVPVPGYQRYTMAAQPELIQQDTKDIEQ